MTTVLRKQTHILLLDTLLAIQQYFVSSSFIRPESFYSIQVFTRHNTILHPSGKFLKQSRNYNKDSSRKVFLLYFLHFFFILGIIYGLYFRKQILPCPGNYIKVISQNRSFSYYLGN